MILCCALYSMSYITRANLKLLMQPNFLHISRSYEWLVTLDLNKVSRLFFFRFFKEACPTYSVLVRAMGCSDSKEVKLWNRFRFLSSPFVHVSSRRCFPLVSCVLLLQGKSQPRLSESSRKGSEVVGGNSGPSSAAAPTKILPCRQCPHQKNWKNNLKRSWCVFFISLFSPFLLCVAYEERQPISCRWSFSSLLAVCISAGQSLFFVSSSFSLSSLSLRRHPVLRWLCFLSSVFFSLSSIFVIQEDMGMKSAARDQMRALPPLAQWQLVCQKKATSATVTKRKGRIDWVGAEREGRIVRRLSPVRAKQCKSNERRRSYRTETHRRAKRMEGSPVSSWMQARSSKAARNQIRESMMTPGTWNG